MSPFRSIFSAMKKFLPIFLLPLLLISQACEPTLIAEFQDKPVVEGYLYAGNSPEIKISRLIAFRDDVQYQNVVIDALDIVVADVTSGEYYGFSAAGDGIYINPSFIAEEGHSYSLQFAYGEYHITADTQVPAKPTGLELSNVTLYVRSMGGGMPGVRSDDDDDDDEDYEDLYPMQVEVSWDNPDDAYYMVLVESTESNPNSIDDFDDDDERPSFSFRKEPVRASSTTISQTDFSYLGRHNVILIRMQPEYVLLYENQDADSQSLIEIHANVENGYGVFTGMNADTTQVAVRRISF